MEFDWGTHILHTTVYVYYVILCTVNCLLKILLCKKKKKKKKKIIILFTLQSFSTFHFFLLLVFFCFLTSLVQLINHMIQTLTCGQRKRKMKHTVRRSDEPAVISVHLPGFSTLSCMIVVLDSRKLSKEKLTRSILKSLKKRLKQS